MTLHDAAGVAYDAPTQSELRSVIVHVGGLYSAAFGAPTSLALGTGSSSTVGVRVVNAGSEDWDVETPNAAVRAGLAADLAPHAANGGPRGRDLGLAPGPARPGGGLGGDRSQGGGARRLDGRRAVRRGPGPGGRLPAAARRGHADPTAPCRCRAGTHPGRRDRADDRTPSTGMSQSTIRSGVAITFGLRYCSIVSGVPFQTARGFSCVCSGTSAPSRPVVLVGRAVLVGVTLAFSANWATGGHAVGRQHDESRSQQHGPPWPYCWMVGRKQERWLTLGRPRGLFERLAAPAVNEMMDRVCERYSRRGATIEDVALPAAFEDVLAQHRVVMAVEAAKYHEGAVAPPAGLYRRTSPRRCARASSARARRHARAKEPQRSPSGDGGATASGSV